MVPEAHDVLVGVIGDPVSHSLSPRLHRAAFGALGLSWDSRAYEVGRGRAADVVDAMKAFAIRGLSVTMPLKEEAADAADRLEPTAARLGSVNCLSLEGGEVVGLSTDGEGLLASLSHAAGFDARGTRVALIGAGGAARAVASALGAVGAAEVVVIARDPQRAARAAALAGSVGRVGVSAEAAACDLVIEATPVGMAATPFVDERSLVDPSALHEGQLAVDLVYHPRETPWLQAAEQAGATTVGGLGMLVHQAALQIERWTSRAAPLSAMWSAVAEEEG
jgi:shikimate dehydrogenase